MKTQSPLSQADWKLLEDSASKLDNAMNEFSFNLLMVAAKLDDSDPLKLKLIDQAEKLPDIGSNHPYFYHCQPEWTGGDSMDPKNFKLREPHVAGLPVRYVVS